MTGYGGAKIMSFNFNFLEFSKLKPFHQAVNVTNRFGGNSVFFFSAGDYIVHNYYI